MALIHILKSILLFISAGLCEIGVGYLVWIWLKNGKPFWYGLSGIILLAAYGFVPTLQNTKFARVYAAYGGVFILLSILWGWKIDRIVPDKLDILGSLICLAGVVIIMLPRK